MGKDFQTNMKNHAKYLRMRAGWLGDSIAKAMSVEDMEKAARLREELEAIQSGLASHVVEAEEEKEKEDQKRQWDAVQQREEAELAADLAAVAAADMQAIDSYEYAAAQMWPMVGLIDRRALYVMGIY